MLQRKTRPFANTGDFYTALGRFYAVWSAVELDIDCAIGKLKQLPPEEAHRLVAAMKFSKKLDVLRFLLDNSKYENVAQLKEFLDRIENETLRNVFAHSFMASDSSSVSFYHRRSRQGQYSCEPYRFEAENFFVHVQNFAQLAHDFERAFGFAQKEVGKFASFALQ